jgi:hypothetical protein
MSAASSNVGPATAGAGSVTGGNGQPTSVPNVAGAASHVTFSAGGWQALVLVGALAMIAGGVLVAWRADRMAVMSGRYDSPAAQARAVQPSTGTGAELRPAESLRGSGTLRPSESLRPAESLHPAKSLHPAESLHPSEPLGSSEFLRPSPPSAGLRADAESVAAAAAGPADSASIWEALSRGDDPTVADTGPQNS